MHTLVMGVVLLAQSGTSGQFVVQEPAPPASVASLDTLRLADLVDQARRENPMLAAARLRADAALERVPQEGALPNPQLTFGLKNRPLDGFGTDQPMTMNAIGAMQRFPWPGIQGFGRERAIHLAVADSLDAAEAERHLIARLRATYYQAAAVDRTLAIMTDTRTLLRAFQDVAQARYAVGEGLQQDVLQAQVAVARMAEDITVAEERRVALAARINALVGRAWDTPVGPLELPTGLTPLPPSDSLTALAVGERPALAAATERVRAAEAGYRAARRTLYPDITLSVEYGERPQFVDFLTFAVGIEIPLWAGKRELPLRREMEATRLREEAQSRDLSNETVARVLELRADAERARRLVTLYDESVLPQARAGVESALSAYRVGDVDYMTLVESQLVLNRYDIQAVLLRADFHRAVAELTALIGTSPGGSP